LPAYLLRSLTWIDKPPGVIHRSEVEGT